jgi:predicted exporter
MAWKLLFGSEVGLFSLVTIAIVIAIGVGLYVFIRRKMAEEENGQPRA